MVEVSIPQEFPDQLADPYRERAQHVLEAIGVYDGSEDRYRGLMDSLISLEQWMVTAFGNGANLRRLPDEAERAITAHYSPDQAGHSIGDMMDMARDHFSHLMEGQGSPEEVIRELPVLHVRLEATLLPPGQQPGPQTGNGEGLRPFEYAPRLQMLIQFLQERGIFTDDLVVVAGINRPNMMRTQSYTLVEVPRLAKEVLICNTVGEATFVSERMLGRSVYFRLSKEQLLQIPGIHKVIFQDQAKWEGEIAALLFSEDQIMSEKLDVNLIEEMRGRLVAEYPPEEWVNWTTRERDPMRPLGTTWSHIARVFGVQGYNPKLALSHLELGGRIYGEENEILKPRLLAAREDAALLERLGTNAALWIEEIKRRFTLTQWMEMNQADRWNLHIAGWGLAAIGAVLGMEGDSRDTPRFLELGRRIYGDQPALLEALERARHHLQEIHTRKQQAARLGDNPDAWREEIRRTFTAEQWVKIPRAERKKMKIAGKGLYALSQIVKTPNNPNNNWLDYLELGAAIYGEDNEHISLLLTPARAEKERSDVLGNDPETWRVRIQEAMSVDAWVGMTLDKRKEFLLAGKGLRSIAKLFGVVGDPNNNSDVAFELAVRIFGGETVVGALGRVDTNGMQYKRKATIARVLEKLSQPELSVADQKE
jgi:hypothetical protein